MDFCCKIILPWMKTKVSCSITIHWFIKLLEVVIEAFDGQTDHWRTRGGTVPGVMPLQMDSHVSGVASVL